MRRLRLLPERGPQPTWRGRRPPPGFRSLKIAVAAMLAYAVSLPLSSTSPPVLAPLTALLISQTTVHKSVTTGLRRVVSVIAGVVIATFLSSVIGLTWWSIGLTVFSALLLGALLRLGDLAPEVPVSALLVLAVSGQRSFAFTRVYETLIGAAVGVVVTVVLAPPVYVQPAGDALKKLGQAMSALLRTIADDLEKEWNEAVARRWLEQGWALDQPISRAREALTHAEDSLRLNPRHRQARQADDSLRSGLAALEHAAITVRSLTTSLVDRVRGVAAGDQQREPTETLRLALAGVLQDAAAAVDAFAELVGSDVTAPWQAEEALATALQRARRRPDALVEHLAGDAHTDPALWQVHGALLANLDRLLHEIDPEMGTQAAGARRNEGEIEPWVAAMRRAARERTPQRTRSREANRNRASKPPSA